MTDRRIGKIVIVIDIAKSCVPVLKPHIQVKGIIRAAAINVVACLINEEVGARIAGFVTDPGA